MTTRRADGLIVVTGAAGKTGRAVLRALVERGAAVRAAVRRPEQCRTLAELGVERSVAGDLESAEAVAAALRGAAAVYHICPNVHPQEVAIGRRVIAAARAAGARRFVFHSVLHPQVEAMPHHWAKLRVEELLFESGLEFTILQPAPYMQNVLAHWREITADGHYPVPYSLETRVAMVDLEDVAAAAAAVLTEPGHGGAIYELCGPELLDQRQIAAALGEALGRSVRARALPRREWRQRAAAAGLGSYQVETLTAMFRYYERFGMAGNPRVLASLLGRSPASFEELAARLAARESPAPPNAAR